MHARESIIDIKENNLFRKGSLLKILLIDRTTKKNIIWATDSYEKFGKEFLCDKKITPKLVTGKYNLLIQPRAAKSLEEQRHRTKDKAEVFTPLNVVDQINKSVDTVVTKNNWQEYVKKLKLEITCGEAPFIVSRYNPTSNTGKFIKLENRVGFLDKKLKVVSKYCDNKKEWLFWAKEAYKSSYGYEWQGDNVLLARENLLYTLIDYYQFKFDQKPSLKIQEEFAEIISWNIFQMDGLKYVVPMSCKSDSITQATIYSGSTVVLEKECEGCRLNNPEIHNGDYSKIMDWKRNKTIRFVDLIKYI
ncbi:MAG: restriction endonuclease subunit M [Candidatus Pacebacteria bacterium]|nr:restriction endonuclease subunit M [Candidatus Paceibacterota bacterium]